MSKREPILIDHDAPRTGRPPFEPTAEERKLVEALSGYGIPQPQICALVRDGIGEDTLRKYFRAEVTRGIAKANAAVAKMSFQKCMQGDTTMLIWWEKTRMGMSDKTIVKVETDEAEKQLRELSNDELRQVAAAVGILAAQSAHPGSGDDTTELSGVH